MVNIEVMPMAIHRVAQVGTSHQLPFKVHGTAESSLGLVVSGVTNHWLASQFILI